jgi:threonine dehydrogenase-like Zn-dependent dehydrogenase
MMLYGDSLFETFCKVEETKETKMSHTKSPWPGLCKSGLASVEIHEAVKREAKIGGEDGFRKAFTHMLSMVAERRFTRDEMMPHIMPLTKRSKAARWMEAMLNTTHNKGDK